MLLRTSPLNRTTAPAHWMVRAGEEPHDVQRVGGKGGDEIPRTGCTGHAANLRCWGV
ncbi:hypothetical protein ACQ86N_13670 [Puia sp. P3]|uniref:hypothetical protein n=1 Tax=Puia sp. P3 TaxID=3423952 RepID=UPI003D66DEF6